jgi:acetyltransferase-like isoleucine patch superfamily enzyme
MLKIAATAIIHPNVVLGEDIVVEDFCIIGLPFKGMKNIQTIIGSGSIIRAGTYIYAGNQIGKNFQTGNKANIRELNQIGDDVSIGTQSVIEHHITIGNNVRIHSQVFVPEYSTLENDCWIGPNVVLTNARYPKHLSVKDELKGPLIGNNAKIGANATILPGITIGKNSLIGAGCVVTKHVAPDTIVVGNPAKPLRKIDYINN